MCGRKTIVDFRVSDEDWGDRQGFWCIDCFEESLENSVEILSLSVGGLLLRAHFDIPSGSVPWDLRR